MTHEQAHCLVRKAIISGALVRPLECSRCGEIPPKARDGRSNIHGHHHDYEKPLDVEWLCVYCHRKETPLPSKPGGKSFGEHNGQAKLTQQDVISAKRLRSLGHAYQAIANRFGVDKKTIMRAVKGEQWAHISAAPTEDKDHD